MSHKLKCIIILSIFFHLAWVLVPIESHIVRVWQHWLLLSSYLYCLPTIIYFMVVVIWYLLDRNVIWDRHLRPKMTTWLNWAVYIVIRLRNILPRTWSRAWTQSRRLVTRRCHSWIAVACFNIICVRSFDTLRNKILKLFALLLLLFFNFL